MRFTVIVSDNFHDMDAGESYKLGPFETLESAVDASKGVVDDYLTHAYRPAMTATALYESYVTYGENPYIVSSGVEGVPFSAWDYAKERCEVLCATEPRAK
jgi:hypothetical protein